VIQKRPQLLWTTGKAKMKKLYAVKMKTIRSKFDGRVVRAGHHTALSLNQLIKLISDKGIGCVETIRHDDKTPRNTRQLNRTETIDLWKVYDLKK
jgi:hypothetical protein